ncbi:MAG: glutamate mutase L [Anaerolineae bacterium]
MTHEPESMVALDVGSAHVKATLIDRVGDAQRFIARGTAPQVTAINPTMPVSAPVMESLRELERIAGRRVVGADGLPLLPEEAGVGIDAVAGTVSMLGTLSVAVAVLGGDTSLRLAEAALHSLPYRMVAKITGREIAGRGNAFERFAQVLRDDPPKVIVLVGGTDRKPDRVLVTMAEAISVAVSLIRPQDRPMLLYAGPQPLRAAIAAAVAEKMPVLMVDNITPDNRAANLGPLRSELDEIYVSTLGRGKPGIDALKQWCGGRITSTGQAMLKVYSHRGLDVLAADVGARQTVLVRSAQGQVLVAADCGVGQGARPLLERSGTAALRSWLIHDLNDDEVGNWALNKELRPWSRCTTPEECSLELSFAREALRVAWQSATSAWPESRGPYPGLPPKVDMVVGGGATLAGSRPRAEVVNALISGLQPIGVVRLALDSGDLVPALGALASINPQAVRSVLERDAITVLGTLIAPVGQGKYGRPALHLEVSVPGGESISRDVASGELLRLPLPKGALAKAIIRPIKPYDISIGAPGQGLEAQVEGGPLGIIVDVRGRPLPPWQRLPERVELLKRWLSALGS